MDFSGVDDLLDESEWTVIHGQSDVYWIGVLRRLQHKVPTDRRYLGP